jgi:hypothetical protein
MTAIRNEIINAIRYMQEKEGIETNRINGVKIAAFKTLIRFIENPSLLEEGPYEGRKTLPENKKRRPKISRRGRKKQKGEFGPPKVNLTKDVEVIEKNQVRVTIGLINNFLHPYQNVNLELDIDPKLSLKSASPYTWKPKENLLHVGFLEAGLDVEPYETEVKVLFDMTKRATKYSISGTLFYDDTDKGRRAQESISKKSFKI